MYLKRIKPGMTLKLTNGILKRKNMKLRKKIGEKIFKDRVSENVNKIITFIRPSEKIIDLGAGTWLFTNKLREKGYDVTPVDVKNRSYFSKISSIVYDGKTLPFEGNSFDVCILIAVLHHTPDPEAILKEAKRVSKKIIIYEDAVTNIFQRYYTYLIDRLLNKELSAPNTNKTDKGWKDLFSKLDLKIVRQECGKSWLFLHNPIYFLEKI